MTDQIFYEELRATIRDAIASYLDTYTAEELRELATESLSLPSLPTLADMTEEERAECQWMQADIIVGHDPLLITRIERSDGTSTILDRNGRFDEVPAEDVTPRPDLPRMVWPGDQAAPALPGGWRLADHRKHGHGMVTNPTPGIDGRVYFVFPATGSLGYDWSLCTPDELTYLDGPESPA